MTEEIEDAFAPVRELMLIPVRRPYGRDGEHRIKWVLEFNQVMLSEKPVRVPVAGAGVSTIVARARALEQLHGPEAAAADAVAQLRLQAAILRRRCR